MVNELCISWIYLKNLGCLHRVSGLIDFIFFQISQFNDKVGVNGFQILVLSDDPNQI